MRRSEFSRTVVGRKSSARAAPNAGSDHRTFAQVWGPPDLTASSRSSRTRAGAASRGQPGRWPPESLSLRSRL